MSALNPEDLSRLMAAAKAARVDANKLQARNPFDPSLSGPVAELVRTAFRELFPDRSSELIADAGVGLSLAAQAVAAGVIEMTPEVMRELEEKDPGAIAALRRQQEAQQLAAIEAAASEAEAKRRAGPSQQQQELEAMALADSRDRAAAVARAQSGLLR